MLPPKIVEDTDESWVDEINIGAKFPKNVLEEVPSLYLEFKDCFADNFIDLEQTPIITFVRVAFNEELMSLIRQPGAHHFEAPGWNLLRDVAVCQLIDWRVS